MKPPTKNTEMISTETKLYAVFGDPVSHSLSPAMHNAAFSATGINSVYLAFKITDIAKGISAVRTLDITGVSITIPHKINVLPFVDEIDATARKIGAVNTLANKNGRLFAINTDCEGAMKALKEKTVIKGKKVAVIGAGGAARAIGFGIDREGGQPIIFNRSVQKGEDLAKDLNTDFFPFMPDMDKIVKKTGCNILINTTSVGMFPNVNACPVPEKALESGMTVMDIIYNPLQTRLLASAEKRGCDVIDGLSMFIWQGAVQFELWTGKKAPVEKMREVVLKNL